MKCLFCEILCNILVYSVKTSQDVTQISEAVFFPPAVLVITLLSYMCHIIHPVMKGDFFCNTIKLNQN